MLRRALVVFQFATSTFLIGGTLIVFQQISFMSDHDLGVDLDQVMVIKASL